MWNACYSQIKSDQIESEVGSVLVMWVPVGFSRMRQKKKKKKKKKKSWIRPWVRENYSPKLGYQLPKGENYVRVN